MSIKFNLERALRGDEVIDGFGDRVSDITVSNKIRSFFNVSCVVNGEYEVFSVNGDHIHCGDFKDNDLYMKYPSTDSPRKFTELDTQIRLPEGQLIL